MTRVTLIHNPTAGGAEHAGDELLKLLSRAGYDAVYKSTKDKDYLKALKNPGGLVVAAGGDGTVRKVARRLVGSGVPLAVLPLGTANNIAKSLGLDGDVRQLIEGLSAARRVKFDVGAASGPWGTKTFFEGAGVGLFTDVMRSLDAKKGRRATAPAHTGERLAAALRALQEALRGYPAHELRATLDGEDVSGRYLLVEAMNIGLVGPNLFLAPDAHPGDGALDFVLLAEESRGEFEEYLSYRLEGKQGAPYLKVRRGRRLQFIWGGSVLHFDDDAWPKKEKKRKKLWQKATNESRRDAPPSIEITLKNEGLEFLVPQVS
jgi:diacylglycerol kinase (ATP)